MDAKSAAARPGLLDDYVSEADLAAELQKDVQDVQRWRKLRVGPPFVMNGVDADISPPGAVKWLQAGGTAGAAKARRRRS